MTPLLHPKPVLERQECYIMLAETTLHVQAHVRRACLHLILSAAASAAYNRRIPFLDHLVVEWRVAAPRGVHRAQEAMCNVLAQRLPFATCMQTT